MPDAPPSSPPEFLAALRPWVLLAVAARWACFCYEAAAVQQCADPWEGGRFRPLQWLGAVGPLGNIMVRSHGRLYEMACVSGRVVSARLQRRGRCGPSADLT